MDRTPQPLVANLVEPLGPHMRQKAPDDLVGGQRQGVPTLVLGVLVAKAPLAIIDGEETGVGQRDAVDISSPRSFRPFLRAVPSRFAGRPPPPWSRPPRDWDQVRVFLAHQIEQQATEPLREGRGRGRGTTCALAAIRFGWRRPRQLAPGSGHAEEGLGCGSGCGGYTRRPSGRPHDAGPSRV